MTELSSRIEHIDEKAPDPAAEELRRVVHEQLEGAPFKVQSGAKVREVVLQPTDPDTILRVAEKQVDTWPDRGEIWLYRVTNGKLSRVRLPRFGEVTTGSVSFKDPPENREGELTTLTKQVAEGKKVHASNFVMPTGSYREQHGVARIVRDKIARTGNLFSRVRPA